MSLIYAPEIKILSLPAPGAFDTAIENAVKGVSIVGRLLSQLLLKVFIVKGNCVLMSTSTLVTVVVPTLKLN
jgi:hypothetical protein